MARPTNVFQRAVSRPFAPAVVKGRTRTMRYSTNRLEKTGTLLTTAGSPTTKVTEVTVTDLDADESLKVYQIRGFALVPP